MGRYLRILDLALFFHKNTFKNSFYFFRCLHGLIRGFEYLPLDGIDNDPSFDSPIIDFVAYYKKGYVNGPIWRILYSPDGIVLGYYYVERPQLPNKANLDFEFK